MKLLPFVFAAAVAMTSLQTAQATSVTFSGAPTARTVVTSNSAQVATPGLAWIGAFSNPSSFTINSGLSLQQNVSNVMASGGWKQFLLDPATGVVDGDATSSLIVSGIGKVGGQVTDNNGTVGQGERASFFDGKPIFLWLFNGTTVSNSSEMGIFRATSALVPWVFPTNANGVGDSVTLSTTSGGASSIAAIGGFGATSSSQFALTNNFNVAPVPEPTTFAVGVFTGLVVIGTRRRRKP
jgi:hypothetical protein